VGLAFVAFFAAGAAVYGSGAGSSDAEIAAYYASQGNRLHQLIGFALVAAAGVLLAVFAGGFASRMAVVGGVLTAALLLVANALWAASAFTVELEPGYVISPRSHLLFEDAGFACFVSAAAAAIPLVVAVSVERTTPRWLAGPGLLAALALALSYFYFPFFVFLAWVALVAATSMRSGS
jgi:cytochrome c oxidase subunit IV